MSYRTVEVELEHGQVRPNKAETLPEKARALLTILSATPPTADQPARSLGQALRELKVQGNGQLADLSTNKSHLNDFGK